jgi:hypothetical protein
MPDGSLKSATFELHSVKSVFIAALGLGLNEITLETPCVGKRPAISTFLINRTIGSNFSRVLNTTFCPQAAESLASAGSKSKTSPSCLWNITAGGLMKAN